MQIEEKIQDLVKRTKNEHIEFIDLWFTDLDGIIKATTIPGEEFEKSLKEGTWFDGSSIEGFSRISESDQYLKPDINTFAVIPFNSSHSSARIICDVYNPDGKPFEGDPRYILKKVIKEAMNLGLQYNVGPELEFFLFNPKDMDKFQPAPHDVGSYFDLEPKDLAAMVKKEIMFSLAQFGLKVEMGHHEVAPGQHEIDFHYDDALTTADQAITLKYVVKSVANKHGLYATFMAKPVYGENGSGMHVHQSLSDIHTGRNAFFDEKDSYKLSTVAKQFMEGQLQHVTGFCAVTSPTVNSYKRLVPGYEAPVYICWAHQNRSALIRVPSYTQGKESATRAELRCPDPSSNPYLAFAVMLKAGLDGIKNESSLREPVNEDVYEFDDSKLKQYYIETLPGSLGEAIQELEKDKVILETLGPHTGPEYIRAKKKEWDTYRTQVTSWEHERYFEKY
jgi:glutamine synthetase